MEKYFIHLIINKELFLNNEITEEMYNKANKKIIDKLNEINGIL